MIDLKHLPNAIPSEETKTVLRRHWTSLVSLAVSVVFVLILPVATLFAIQYASPTFYDDPVRVTLLVLGLSTFFLYAWLFLFQHYIDYHLDVWIVTNRRILNIEQHGLFSRTVSELRLHRVQDVTAEVQGFLHTMLDYGNVFIQTAGEKQRFEFEEIPHPNQVAKLILDLAETDRKNDFGQVVEEFKGAD
jgi:membrane protein YdbS with pleckstrin-like domain